MLNKNLIKKYITPMFPVTTDMNPNGQLACRVKCILFDVYGTLFISSSGDINDLKNKTHQINKLEKLVNKFEFNMNPYDLIESYINTIKINHDELRKKGIDFPEIRVERIWMSVLNTDLESAIKFALEFEWLFNPVYPMPHLEKVLLKLKRLNVKMGLLTNAQFYTMYLFEIFFESNIKYFGFDENIIILSYRYSYAKPSEYLFNLAKVELEKKNIMPDEVLYIGNDMLNDILPAKKAGFNTALFAGDQRSLRLRKEDDKCIGLDPDLVLTELTQLFSHV